MRLLALLLLFANIALWAYMDYAAPRFEVNALAQQVQPDRLRLLSEAEVAQMPAVGKGGAACIEFGPIDDAKLALAKELARTLQENLSMAERRAEGGNFLEVRAPNDLVRKELGQLLTGVHVEACPG